MNSINRLDNKSPDRLGATENWWLTFWCWTDWLDWWQLLSLNTVKVIYITYLSSIEKNPDNYKEEFIKLFKDAKEELSLKNNSKEKEDEVFMKLVTKIWVLWKSFWVNTWYNRLISSWNPDFKDDIFKSIFDIKEWENCFFVPWCFSNLAKIIIAWTVDQWKVKLTLWNWVNIQEWVWFLKTEWKLWKMSAVKFNDWEKLEQIHLNIWSNSSLAHWASFYPWHRIDIDIEAWEWVFFWINSLVWSWAKIGNFTTIWWNSNLGNNVTLWKSVIVWTSCTIADNVSIPDDCLIPNFSKITSDYKLITYEEYISNQNKYITEHNYVIKISSFSESEVKNLSNNEISRKQQLNKINPNYNQIRKFNKHNVVPENKIFSCLEDAFSFLNETIWFEPIRTYEYIWDEGIFDKKLTQKNIELSLKDNLNWFTSGQKKSRLTLKAYPKNAENFLNHELLPILEELKSIWNLTSADKNLLISRIENLVDRPKIDPENMSKTFFWNCYITWKFEYKNSLFFNLRSRWDELKESENIYIEDSIWIWTTIHWGWNKQISNTTMFDLVAHWPTDYEQSSIWLYWRKSVANNCEIKNSNIWWELTANWAKINSSTLWNGVSLAWWSGDEQTDIQDSSIWEEVSIWPWTSITDKLISPNRIIGQYLIINRDSTMPKIRN